MGSVDGILLAACLGMLAVGANGTAIMAALPTMRQDLGLDGSAVEWAVNAYLVVSAACIISGGKFSDAAGANRVARLGLLLFAIASVIIAIAGSPAVLIIGRALQGLGAALAVPGTLAAIGTVPAGRAARIGAWAGFLMVGFSIGPLMGGALTHYFSWRVIFWCNAAAMLVATAGFMLRRGLDPPFQATDLARFDWTGFVLVATFMTSLVAMLQAIPLIRDAPVRLLIRAVIACGALFLLIRAEPNKTGPLIDMRVFAVPAFIRALAIGSIAMFSILALLLYFNLDAQSPTGLGFSAVDAGLSLLPLSAGLLVCAFSSTALVRRFGARKVLTVAMLLIAIAAVGVAASVAARTLIPTLIPLGVSLFAIGSGLALPYTSAPRMALATLPADQAGQSSGIINACTFLGGSMGVAAGAIAFNFGGLSAVMAMISAAALAGAWVCRGLATP
jgi:MFS family permease